MLLFRLLVRLKIFQLGGVAACSVPLATILNEVLAPRMRAEVFSFASFFRQMVGVKIVMQGKDSGEEVLNDASVHS